MNESNIAITTPLTDALSFRAVIGQHPEPLLDRSMECVPADFARELEMELAKVRDSWHKDVLFWQEEADRRQRALDALKRYVHETEAMMIRSSTINAGTDVLPDIGSIAE